MVIRASNLIGNVRFFPASLSLCKSLKSSPVLFSIMCNVLIVNGFGDVKGLISALGLALVALPCPTTSPSTSKNASKIQVDTVKHAFRPSELIHQAGAIIIMMTPSPTAYNFKAQGTL